MSKLGCSSAGSSNAATRRVCFTRFGGDLARSQPGVPPTNPVVRAVDWLLALISPLL